MADPGGAANVPVNASVAEAFEVATRKFDAELEAEMEDSPFNDCQWQEGPVFVVVFLRGFYDFTLASPPSLLWHP